MANNFESFKATKSMFMGAFDRKMFPLSFEDWDRLDTDLKAAALFINFYREITLAWDSYVNAPITGEAAVSEVLDVLMKNVHIISNAPERYTPQYIYHISKIKILGAVRPICVNQIYNSEISNIAYADDNEVDLFDLCPYEDEPYEVAQAREALWAILEGMGPKALKVADHIINGNSLRRSHKRARLHPEDKLAEVSVSADEYAAIVKEIKKQIAPLGFAWGY